MQNTFRVSKEEWLDMWTGPVCMAARHPAFKPFCEILLDIDRAVVSFHNTRSLSGRLGTLTFFSCLN